MLTTDRQTDAYLRFKTDFHKVCGEFSDKIAITYYKKRGMTEECAYSEMEKRVCSLAKTYESKGIRRGDRVAVLIPLCTNAYLDILSLAYMGATSVVLDINLNETELKRILDDADVSCIITTRSLYESKMTKVKVPVYEESDECKCIKSGTIIHSADADMEAIAILYSSGTTSNAKGVVIGYEQENNAMDYLLKVVGSSDIRYLMLFPNSHVSGFTDFLVLLMRGGALATMEEASAVQLVQGFHLYRPNTFGMVPKVWENFKIKIEEGISAKGEVASKIIFSIISFCGFVRSCTGINLGRKIFQSINEEVFGGKLQSIHSGGGKSSPEVMKFFWNLGYDVLDFYASTEANIPILVTNGKKWMDSVGDIHSNPNTTIRIYNPDQNGIGEIQVRNNTMMRGYFRNDELTRTAFEDGFFKTGDYGKIIDGELFITGRIKESIHLKNGEKLSPDDLENLYRSYFQTDFEYAVVGIPDKEGYSEVCICVVGEKGCCDAAIKTINKQVSVNNQIKRVEYVDELPKTSVGKVRRFQLQKIICDASDKNIDEWQTSDAYVPAGDATIDDLINLISKHTQVSVCYDSKLRDDLMIDSLSLLELCVNVETIWGINIADSIDVNTTPQDILNILHGQSGRIGKQLDKYPRKKRPIDRFIFNEFRRWSKRHYDIEVHGLNYLNENENYIFTPNHESHLDGMWMLSILPDRYYESICSMAADYLFRNIMLKWGTYIMGGIPVDRTGNSTKATKRILDLLRDGNHSLLIHPEGTRTRNGVMGDFKTGAAEIALKSGLKVIPVGIAGAYDIFPANKIIPRMGKDKNGNKYKLKICFGSPVDVSDFTNISEATAEIEKRVKILKEQFFRGADRKSTDHLKRNFRM